VRQTQVVTWDGFPDASRLGDTLVASDYAWGEWIRAQTSADGRDARDAAIAGLFQRLLHLLEGGDFQRLQQVLREAALQRLIQIRFCLGVVAGQ
jgi:hypothetical protein